MDLWEDILIEFSYLYPKNVRIIREHVLIALICCVFQVNLEIAKTDEIVSENYEIICSMIYSKIIIVKFFQKSSCNLQYFLNIQSNSK